MPPTRAILALILLVGLSIPAQADPPPANSTPQQLQAGVDLDFPGGTLGELADLLSKDPAATVRLNLIVDPQYRKLTIPAIHVRNASSYALSDALDRMLRPQGAAVQALGQGGGGFGDPVFVLVPVKAEETQESALAFRSYAVSDLLDRYTPEQIASALRTAWELDPAHDPAALLIKYHPETRLLFVAGPDERNVVVIRSGVPNRRPAGSAIRLTDEIIENLALQRNPPKAVTPEGAAAVAPK